MPRLDSTRLDSTRLVDMGPARIKGSFPAHTPFSSTKPPNPPVSSSYTARALFLSFSLLSFSTLSHSLSNKVLAVAVCPSLTPHTPSTPSTVSLPENLSYSPPPLPLPCLPAQPIPAMEYFTTFPTFTLHPNEALRNAFKRLAKSQNWNKDRTANEKTKFQKLVVLELNKDFNKLEHLQDLCQKLFPDKPVPTSITQCNKLLKTKYINIWDIVEHKYKYFDKYADFQKYTRKGRVFKKELAKSLNFRVFLRQL